MSGKLSIKTLRGKQFSEKVGAAIEATDLEKVAEALRELYAPVLEEGEEMPDWVFLLELDRRLIVALSNEAEDADRNRSESVATQVRFTVERDTKSAFLRGVLRGIIQRIRAAYGEEALVALGLARAPSRQSEALAAEADGIRRRCLTPELQPTTLKPGAEPFDWQEVAAEIEEPTLSLLQCIASRKSRQEEAVGALLVKHVQQDQQYLGHTFVVEATLRMAGLKEEASRLRLTLRRRPGIGEEPQDGRPQDTLPQDVPPLDAPSHEGEPEESEPPGAPPSGATVL